MLAHGDIVGKLSVVGGEETLVVWWNTGAKSFPSLVKLLSIPLYPLPLKKNSGLIHSFHLVKDFLDLTLAQAP